MKNLSTYLTEKLQAKPLQSFFGNPWYEIKDNKFYCQMIRFEEPSAEYGIDGGRISRLWITEVGTKKVVAEYDRKWIIEPNRAVKKFYDEIIKEYN